MYYIPVSDLYSWLNSLFDFDDFILVSIWSESLEDNDHDTFANRLRFGVNDAMFSVKQIF